MNPPPTMILDLDLPPEKRWVKIVPPYRKTLLEILSLIDSYSDQVPLIGSLTKKALLWMITQRLKSAEVMYQKELESIAQILEQPVEKVILMQLCYEAMACCTTIACWLQGQPVHFRTMDWAIPQMKEATLELHFQKGGKTLFTAITYAGAVGVFTGMKPGDYSVALNFRRTGVNVFKNLYRAMTNCWPIGYLIRQTLEQGFNFSQAEEIFSRSQLISPGYLSLLSAKGEARVLIRDREETVIRRKRTISSPFDYLIQTNIDPGEPSEAKMNLLWSIERKALAEQLLKKEYKTPEQMLSSFLKWPILNFETVHASILGPQTGLLVTTIPPPVEELPIPKSHLEALSTSES